MPIPVSRTDTLTRWSVGRAVSQMCPPFSVYLAALFSKFVRHLCDCAWIGVEVNRLRRQANRQLVSGGVDERARCFDRARTAEASSMRPCEAGVSRG